MVVICVVMAVAMIAVVFFASLTLYEAKEDRKDSKLWHDAYMEERKVTDRLSTQVEVGWQLVEELTKSYRVAEEHLRKLRKLTTEQETQLTGLRQDVANYETETAAWRQTSDQDDADFKRLREELMELREQVATRSGDIHDLCGLADRHEAEIRRLRKMASDYESEVGRLRQEAEDFATCTRS